LCHKNSLDKSDKQPFHSTISLPLQKSSCVFIFLLFAGAAVRFFPGVLPSHL